MKKAVISNRILMNATGEFRDSIVKQLTYVIPKKHIMEPDEVIYQVSAINDEIISIPSGRVDLIPEDYEIVDRTVTKPHQFPEFKMALRPSQQKAVDAIDRCGIINAKPGWGKTFTGIALMTKLGQKTLVVVHTKNLLYQWKEEVEKCLGISPGLVGDGHKDLDKPVVIGISRSLYKLKNEIKKGFGTLLVDEMHHTSSRTFYEIIDTSYARNKVGLSGTIKRKDGKDVIFADYFTSNIIKPEVENTMTPIVHIFDAGFAIKGSQWSIRMNKLANNLEYVHFIAGLAATYAAAGHTVLVVSDRTKMLKLGAELAGEKAVCVTGELGDRQEAKRQLLSGEKNILFGARGIYSEGESINTLSCLILASPINNDPLLEQLIGRIQRLKEGKKTPIIVDIVHKDPMSKSQAEKRLGFYLKQGYTVEDMRKSMT